MNLRHGGPALVVLEGRRRVLGRAAEENAEELVEVRNERVLLGARGIGKGGHGLQEGRGTTTVKEVDRLSLAVDVGAEERAVEVLYVIQTSQLRI